jgi:hypothetical protein
MPKVSGRRREYSRFWEVETGDIVRSRLPPDGGSPFLLVIMEFGLFGAWISSIRSHSRGGAQTGRMGDVLVVTSVPDGVA